MSPEPELQDENAPPPRRSGLRWPLRVIATVVGLVLLASTFPILLLPFMFWEPDGPLVPKDPVANDIKGQDFPGRRSTGGDVDFKAAPTSEELVVWNREEQVTSGNDWLGQFTYVTGPSTRSKMISVWTDGETAMHYAGLGEDGRCYAVGRVATSPVVDGYATAERLYGLGDPEHCVASDVELSSNNPGLVWPSKKL